MAWISIHDTIDGPKLRDLHKKIGCSKFEAVGILVFLWQWGLHNADEEGHLVHADRDDVERFLHGVASGCSADEKSIFNALLEAGWIDDADGELYLHDWKSWQKEWYNYRRRLKRDSERKRRIGGEKTEEGAKTPEEAPKKEGAPPQKAKKAQADYPEEFARFWDIYPRKDRKAEAYGCFKARVSEGMNPEDMILAAQNYAAKCRKENTPSRYIQQAKTFLGIHLNFLDHVPKKEQAEEDPETNPFDRYVEG